MSMVYMGISFFVELIFLILEFFKVMFWTVFYFIFSPTEKYVRNEIVLITGTGKGLGRALAIQFAKRGSILVLIDIDDTENSKTVELVKTTGLNSKRIYAYHCDLKSREEIREVCECIRRDVGEVTIIINNAAIQAFRSFMECKEEEFISTMRVNIFASYWFLKEFLPSMLSRNHGHIISVASSAGLFGFCHMSDNCTSKFALVGMMESLDHELTLAGYDGIHTTLVYPASINTTLYAKSRHLFNYLTTPLPPQIVAKKIMHAILVNQKNVCVPRILYLLSVIKSILPSKAFMLIANFVLQPSRPNLEVNMMIDFDRIAKACYDFYDEIFLTKSKPTNSEWTNMAAILITKDEKNFQVLSMATGSKCLSEKKLPVNGSLVHDSHAEILARRCFLRYMYNEMNQILDSNDFSSDVFILKDNKFSVKEEIQFILFTSHTPCGDASIIPKSCSKRSLQEDTDCIKRIKTEISLIQDIHRTGAKCVPSSLNQDPKEKGVLYHVTGVVRTKPGRGDPTISMSCSDKIAKWLVLGIQGSLLSNLLAKPIYLNFIVIGKCPYSYESVERALINRSKAFECRNNYKLTIPLIGQSNLCFKESKLIKFPDCADYEANTDFKACPNSICWSYGLNEKSIFVLVKGLLQGTSVKNLKKSSNYPPICKYYFFSKFEQIFRKINSNSLVGLNYYDIKKISNEYNKAKQEFFRIFSDWIRIDQEKYYKFILK